MPFWPTSAPPPVEEVPLGLCHGGGVFAFDPFSLVAQGYLSGPNVLVVGEIGQGKSALVKLLLARSCDRGRSLLVLDPKGEYAAHATRLGAEIIQLAGDGGVDPFAGCGRRAPRVAGVLARLARLGLGRELVPVERILLGQLARVLLEGLDRPSLSAARDVLVGRQLVGRLPVGVQAEAEGHGLALIGALDRLLEGDLAGVFAPDGGTRSLPPRVIVAIDPTWDRSLAAAAVAALVRARGSQLAGGLVTPGYIVLDEAWSYLVDPEAVREIRSLFKLARSYGASLLALTHRLSDLTAEARGIVEDAETRVVLRQPPGEREALRQGLGLAHAELDEVVGLHRGEALWLMGRHRFLVTHLVLDEERALVDTDGRMR